MTTATSSWPTPTWRRLLKRRRTARPKSALVVSPTHAEANRITDAIRAGLKAQGKLGEERIVTGWVPAHLTDAQKADATEYEPGDLLQFHQNAPGYKKGSRLIVGEAVKPPTELADRFEVYRPTQFALAVGDRVRVTAGGKTKDGKHRLSNGSLLTVQGFTKRGDLIVDHGWVIDRDFGHLTHGYVGHKPRQPGRDRGQGLHRRVERIVPGDLPADGLCGRDAGQGTGPDFHGRQERAAEGGQPAGRSDVGDGAFASYAAEADLAGSPDEAPGDRSADGLPLRRTARFDPAGCRKRRGANEEMDNAR